MVRFALTKVHVQAVVQADVTALSWSESHEMRDQKQPGVLHFCHFALQSMLRKGSLHRYAWRDAIICVERFYHMCGGGSIIYVEGLCNMCGGGYHMCGGDRSCVWRDSTIYVEIYNMCGGVLSYVWRGSVICVEWIHRIARMPDDHEQRLPVRMDWLGLESRSRPLL